MQEEINEQINEVGGKIDTIYTLIRVLMSSMLGTEELSEKDTGNLLYILEEKIKDLKFEHDALINRLGI